MSGPPRLQVLAEGAFLSPAKVLRVMEPTHEASWTRAGITRARDAGAWRLSWIRRGAPRQPLKPRAPLWSLSWREPSATLPHLRPGRGAQEERSGASGGWAPPAPRPGAPGTHADPAVRPGLLGKGLQETSAWLSECSLQNFSTRNDQLKSTSSMYCSFLTSSIH